MEQEVTTLQTTTTLAIEKGQSELKALQAQHELEIRKLKEAAAREKLEMAAQHQLEMTKT